MKDRIALISKFFLIGATIRWASLGFPGWQALNAYWMGSDALCYTGLLQLMKEEFWIPFTAVTSQRLSYPEGMAYPQWPMTDIFHWTTMHVMNLLSPSPVLTYNLYYILGSGLVTATMGLLCLSLGLGMPLSVATAVVYAGLPFYFERLYHLFLAVYFQVPLIFYVLLNLRKKIDWKVTFFIGAIVGATGIYYAFFAILLVAIFFLAICVYWREFKQAFMNSFYFGSGLILVLVSSMMSNILYTIRSGNPDTNQRSAHESILWGLDVSNIILPPTNHWFPGYAGIRSLFFTPEQMFEMAPFEGYHEYLGLAAWLGLLFCVFALFKYVRSRGKKVSIYLPLGAIAAFCIFLAIKGGLGYQFALHVTPQIRSWNRASIFVATAGLLAFSIFVQPYLVKYVPKKLTWLACLAFAVFFLGEQGTFYRPIKPAIEETASDIEFSKEIKAILGDKPVLGIPFGVFPDWRGYPSIEPYGNFRYLLHEKVHSVFPAIKGTKEANEKVRKFYGKFVSINELVAYGLGGVVIDTHDVPEFSMAAIRIYGVPGAKRVASRNGRFLFYSLTPSTP